MPRDYADLPRTSAHKNWVGSFDSEPSPLVLRLTGNPTGPYHVVSPRAGVGHPLIRFGWVFEQVLAQSSSLMLGAEAVTMSQPVSEGESDLMVKTEPSNPLKNPSYPQRVHLHERAHWEGVLKGVEDRISKARQKLDVIGSGPNRSAFERLYAQMLGARDQIADSARRMPTETGGLYAEDRHRLEEGVAAIDRIFQRWEAQTVA